MAQAKNAVKRFLKRTGAWDVLKKSSTLRKIAAQRRARQRKKLPAKASAKQAQKPVAQLARATEEDLAQQQELATVPEAIEDEQVLLEAAEEGQEVSEQRSEEEIMLQDTLELEEVKQWCAGFDRDHLWAFVAGHTGQDFRGNPKYLFVYVNKYREDTHAYWFCDNEETIEQVRGLGFRAYRINSPAMQYLVNRTGVVVAEQVKHAMPVGFENVKYLNLWHGIGFKKVERRVFSGNIAMPLARKYVMRGTFYRDWQLMVVTCPTIEEEFALDAGVDRDHFLRTGYARCLYQKYFDPIISYDHDLRAVKGLSEDTRYAVYAPTYRANLGGTFARAIEDFEALHQVCEEANLLLIFKVHSSMEQEVGFRKAQERYQDYPRFWFWDNRNDFYEIMHQMDLAIVDYSSIISDMVAMGVPHYIRYVFDYDEYISTVSTHDNYHAKTTGEVCCSFDNLLGLIATYEQRDESLEIERLNKELWTYSEGKADFENTVEAVFAFQPTQREFPTLYSFDIFDTVLSRNVLAPAGIFYAVRERMWEEGSFPSALVQKYPEIRHTAEFNVREYYTKTKVLRDSDSTEVTFAEVLDRLADVYGLDNQQKALLETWETEAEIASVVPVPHQIDIVKKLLGQGEVVVLVSDMYLPRETIKAMLAQADPILSELPLFLSNDYGVLKTSQKLYFEVYKSFEPYYDFKKWVHYGDNDKADITQARRFEICARKVRKPHFNSIQSALTEYVDTYDSFLVAAMQARMCFEHDIYAENRDDLYNFTVSYIALCFVPYIDWVLRDAQRRGHETLYFISRDGHHLKRIADAIIEVRGIPLKTKLIYASRRTWRIPSFIDEVDPGFWEPYGSFHEIQTKRKLFEAMDLDENIFRGLFPYVDPDEINFESIGEFRALVNIFRNSRDYNAYLLEKAAEERVLVEKYLRQEIEPSENFAFVEYYGRGYTQDAFVNLWRNITSDGGYQAPFYYMRTVLPTLGSSIRYNFTTNDTKPYFIESIFANMPYKSIEEYVEADGVVRPVIHPIPYNHELFDSMEQVLPEMARRYAALPLTRPEDTDRLLMEFVYTYYKKNRTEVDFASVIGPLKDSIALYGTKREYAPALTEEILHKFKESGLSNRSMLVSTDIAMSVVRSDDDIQAQYRELYQVLPGDKLPGGRMLSEGEREENLRFKVMCEELEQKADEFRRHYEQCLDEVSIEDKIVFLTEGKTIDKTGLALLRGALQDQDRYSLKTICLGAKKALPSIQVAHEIASARFVLVATSIGLLCKTELRLGTQEIMLRENAFYLYNQALAMNYFLKWKNRYHTLKGKNSVSVLQVPSPGQEEIFRLFFSHELTTKCDLVGCNISDVYFDSAYAQSAREKLAAVFPEGAGKKTILYMPTLRTRNRCKMWFDLLDMELLQRSIGDEYVIAVHFNKKQINDVYLNEVNVPGFSKLIDGGISLRELMVASDVVVGDYRDTFFEAPIMRKPCFSTAYDYETFIKAKNMRCRANDFEEFLFCPVVRSAFDLATHVANLESYDYTAQDEFREKMFSACDGNSVQRTKDYLLSLRFDMEYEA